MVLAYHPWQIRAALLRLLGGILGLALLLWAGLAGGGFLALLALLGAGVGAFYLLRTGWEPLRRRRLRVELLPDGVRVGGAFYPKGEFLGLEDPLGSWTWLEERPQALQRFRLHLAPPWQKGPLFRLRFRTGALPLPLDLPGWDRLLRHLGLSWREHPGLSRYLATASGPAWLNGLLYPPEEALEGWQEARRRYQRAWAWIWAGVGLMAVGFGVGLWALAPVWARVEGSGEVALPIPALGVGALLVLLGLFVGGWAFFAAFNVGRGRPGWAVAYNPLWGKHP
ncbi:MULTISPECIES: hypothetical protein [Thermus]|uniref:hypothetical protein n=1 Tax=Thermus TaxID=270 RepID=UPI001F3F1B04|nr:MULTISPECIES: hypothetical protein [Thermus]